MDNLLLQIQNLLDAFIQHLPFALTLVGILWLIHIVNFLLRYRLNIFGIYPRSWHGLIGIFISPLLHGSFNHLFLNSIPLLIFFDFFSFNGLSLFSAITLTIIILSGTLIWLFGRKALHIGASGLIMGYMGFLLVDAYSEPGITTILLAIIAIYYFGISFLSSIIAPKATSSWEGHIFGVIAGLITEYLATSHYFF